ncbi:hypothetical protein KKC88_00960 [Patescibacteria group bacterium]|nr:hypothetical protein [Patescibacteria group bacterium]MBU1673329.1 hypothetical protein [Patescibacteria group bacterium]MBU1963552.1 hypothetical protein [Patescibacteria group bacterium]
MADAPQQEQEPSKVVDMAEARLAREQQMEDMESKGELVEVDGEKIPIGKLGEVADLLKGKVVEFSSRMKSNEGLMEGVEGGNLDSVKEKLLGEQKDLEQRRDKAEKEAGAIEAFKWGGGKLIELGAYIPGSTDFPRLLDRYGGRALTGDDGIFLSPEDHARIAKNQSKMGKWALKGIGAFVPEAKVLTKIAEPFAAKRAEMEAKKEEMAKRGEKMSLQDEMAEYVGVIPDKSLKDPKVIGKLGEFIGGAGGELGGAAGEKIGELGKFVGDNPEAASKILTSVKSMIAEKKFNVSPDMVDLIKKYATGEKNNVEDMGDFTADDEGRVMEAEEQEESLDKVA